jgi:heme A synthase
MRSTLRLDPRFRFALYGAFAVLFVTGAAWLPADRLKDSPNGELWQQIAANLLMVHGGAAMVALLFLGALYPVHIRLGWRSGRNRLTGPAMVTFNVLLVATAFGLYYLGAETLRPWMSAIHIAVGFALPALFIAHVVLGRRSSARASSD